MSLQTFVGSFALRSGTGSQSITGVGFQPKAIIIYAGQGGPIDSTTNQVRMGFYDGTNQMSTAMASGDAAAAYVVSVYAWGDDSLLLGVKNYFSFPFKLVAVGTSLDADGFTINVTTNVGCDGNVFNYIAIGGAGVLAKVGKITNPGSTGNLAITGVGFKPVVIFSQPHVGVQSGSFHSIGSTGSLPGLGITAQCGSTQFGTSNNNADSANPSNSHGETLNNQFLVQVSQAPAETIKANIVSFDNDGFTVNFTNIAGSTGGAYQGYLALGGALSANLVEFTQPAATGAQTTTILMNAPQALILVSPCKAASSSITANELFSFGAADGTRQRSIWAGEINGSAPRAPADGRLDTSHVITMAIPTGDFASTITGQASLTSLNPTNFILNWNITDGVARQIFALALGVDVGTGACGIVAPETGAGIYREVIGKTHDTLYV